jgi:hypothetical protein
VDPDRRNQTEKSSLLERQNLEGKAQARRWNKWLVLLWVIFICISVFTLFLCPIRMVSLLVKKGWRSKLNGGFPSHCGTWAEKNGCTRVTLYEDDCVRVKEIPEYYSIVFDSLDDGFMSDMVSSCLNKIPGAKIMDSNGIGPAELHDKVLHTTINSFVFGFIDDLYVLIYQ